MSAPDPPTTQQSQYAYPNVQPDGKPEATIHATEIRAKKKFYKPVELRTPFLVAFCVVILAIFTLLSITATAYSGNARLHALVIRPALSEDATTSVVPTTSMIPDDLPQSSDTAIFTTPSMTTDPINEPTSTTDSIIDPNSTINSNDDPTTTIDPNADPTSTSSSEPTVGAPAPGSYVAIPAGWGGYYFIGAYLPTLVAILIGTWWKCIYTRMKEMEPFYQMAKPEGAKVKDSLLLSYTGLCLPWVFLASFFSGRRLTFLGALNTILILVCTILASSTVYISYEGDSCGVILNTTESSNSGCHLTVVLNHRQGWALSALLFAVFVLTLCSILWIRRKVSKIEVDPTSIAGSACLLNDNLSRELVQSIQDPSKRYTIDSTFADGATSIVPWSSTPGVFGRFHHHHKSAPNEWKFSNVTIHPATLTALWLFQLGIIVLLVYYEHISKAESGSKFELFMNSNSRGPSILMTILGLAVKFYWGWIEGYMRTMRPYMALASRHGATAANSVLLRGPSHPITALLQGDSWRHPLLAVVTLMSILSEVLVVTLTTVPFKPASVLTAFKVSVYISVGILAAMVLTVTAVIVWTIMTKSRNSLPNVPECIADVFDLLGDEEGRRAMRGLYQGAGQGNVLRRSNMRFALQLQGEDARDLVWRIVVLPSAHSAT